MLLAALWLGWRDTRTPRFPRLSGITARRTSARLLLTIAYATVVLCLQNDFAQSAAYSSH